MSTPFLAIFLTAQKDISLLHTGFILSINPLINVMFGSFGGRLADKFSLKKIIGGIPLVWGSAFILFYFADSFWHFLLLSGLNGLCYSIFEPASKKVLSAQTTPDNRLLVFNLRYSAINLGAFIGPLLRMLFNMKLTLFPYVILGILYILYGVKVGTIAGPLAGSRLLGHFGVQAGFPVFALLCAITVTGAGLIGIAKSKHGSIIHAQQPQEEYPA